MENSSRPNHLVALFDICHTLVGVTTITDFTDHFLFSPKRNQDFRFEKLVWHRVFRFLYRFRLVRPDTYRAHFIALYEGQSRAALAVLAQAYAERLRSTFNKPILEKMQELAQKGYEIYLVSAGLDAYLKPFAASLGAHLICTVLEKDSAGVYTGRVAGLDCVGEGKVTKVQSEIVRFGEIDWQNSYAFGDSLSDIPVLSLAGNVWVVDPEPALERHAHAHGWNIVRLKPAS